MEKYVYKVYYSNETINCEKCPIIYQNNEYIYFKQHSSKKLGCEEVHRCKRSIRSLGQCFNLHFINHIILEEPTQKELESLKEKINADKKERDIKMLISKIKSLNEDMKTYQEELDLLFKQQFIYKEELKISEDKNMILENLKALIVFNTYEMLSTLKSIKSIEVCLNETPNDLLPCPSSLGVGSNRDICDLHHGDCKTCWESALE